MSQTYKIDNYPEYIDLYSLTGIAPGDAMTIRVGVGSIEVSDSATALDTDKGFPYDKYSEEYLRVQSDSAWIRAGSLNGTSEITVSEGMA